MCCAKHCFFFFSESETKRINVCMRIEEWVDIKVGVTCVDV